MKIDLPIEEGYFNIDPCVFCGIDSYLITPQADAKWNKNNLHLRSIIVDKNKNVLSSGFPKFFNYGEKPDCYPDPEKYHDWKIEEKKDGSLLITDFVNGEFSMRTRGTSCYKSQLNYQDFESLPIKYPKLVEFLSKNSHLSILFEIITPSNVIVIRPKELEFTFLNAIDKNTLKIVSAQELLEIWRSIGCPPAPEIYSFNESRDLSLISSIIKKWIGKEGVILTYNNGQNKLKIKSNWYLFIHTIKSQLSSINNLIDQYINWNMPDYDIFYKKIETDYDFEIAYQIKDEIKNISEAGEKAKTLILEISKFIHSIKNIDRKEQAFLILEKYGEKKLSGLAFSILDNKKIEYKHKFYLIKNYIII